MKLTITGLLTKTGKITEHMKYFTAETEDLRNVASVCGTQTFLIATAWCLCQLPGVDVSGKGKSILDR